VSALKLELRKSRIQVLVTESLTELNFSKVHNGNNLVGDVSAANCFQHFICRRFYGVGIFGHTSVKLPHISRAEHIFHNLVLQLLSSFLSALEFD
jgi:hypothetical protein